MNVAIILAGGKGVRMGLDIPKQFAEVLGKPVIAYTLDIFQQHQEIDAIEIVCARDEGSAVLSVSNRVSAQRQTKESIASQRNS